MDKENTEALEKLLGRELEAAERQRMERIQDALNLGPNDALWAIIAALEFQRTYYEELPVKIRQETEKICEDFVKNISGQKYSFQNSSKNGSIKFYEKFMQEPISRALPIWGSISILGLIFFGCLCMWGGYSIGTRQFQPPMLILQMPVGIFLGAFGILISIVMAVLYIINIYKKKKVYIYLIILFTVSTYIFCISL